MTELNQVFDGDLAERVFLIVSAIFVALYACEVLLVQRTEAGARRTAFHGKTAATVLFLTVAISLAANGLGLFNPSRAVRPIIRPRSQSSSFKRGRHEIRSRTAGGEPVLMAHRNGCYP
jgi:hypothetical protein